MAYQSPSNLLRMSVSSQYNNHRGRRGYEILTESCSISVLPINNIILDKIKNFFIIIGYLRSRFLPYNYS